MHGVDPTPLAEPPRAAAATPWKWQTKAIILTLVWFITSVVNVVVIKETTKPTGIFPHGFAFTALVQPTTGLFAWLLFKFQQCGHGKPAPASLTRRDWVKVTLFGVIQGCEIGLTNKASEYLTVAGRTEINAFSVLFIMLSARFWGLEPLCWRRLLCLAVLILGGLVQSPGHGGDAKPTSSQVLGALLQVTSMVLSSQRWCLAQMMLSNITSKLHFLSKVLPITGLVCVPLALAFEPDAWNQELLLQPALLVRVLFVAGTLSAMLFAELTLVELLSAVSLYVLGIFHQIPLIVFGVVLNHDTVSPPAILGFALCIMGSLIYRWARLTDRKAEA